MYTIRQAASRSGVPVNTIRAWERRYGLVAPARTDSGYRLYDEAAIQRLDAMRRLVADGMPPSVAAVELAQRPMDTLVSIAPADDTLAGEQDDLAVRTVDAFVAGAVALDQRAISNALDDMFSRGSFERVAATMLFPALHRVGDAWNSGEISIAGEHLASAAVQRRLGQLFEAAGSVASTGPHIVVGLPSGSRHELGALAFAIAARRAGFSVDYVSADLPAADWLTAARSARAAVVGVPTRRDVAAADGVIAALATELPDVVVATGGSAAPDRYGVLRLPDDLSQAVSALRARLRPGEPGQS
jgi:DNA-binding transcriptional MerR regulator/methylmalonyl-CoA mutase cobalamin-binding subunit